MSTSLHFFHSKFSDHRHGNKSQNKQIVTNYDVCHVVINQHKHGREWAPARRVWPSGRPLQQLVLMENTRQPQQEPIVGTHRRMPIPQRLPGSRTERRSYSSEAQHSNNSNQTERSLILHCWFPNNTHTHTRKHSLAHVEAIILLLVKSLLYSLLFSQARESNLSTKEC